MQSKYAGVTSSSFAHFFHCLRRALGIVDNNGRPAKAKLKGNSFSDFPPRARDKGDFSASDPEYVDGEVSH
jgi:hypothetical protein